MRFIKIALLICLIQGFTSCEDVISVKVEQSQVKLVVDAFINNMDTTQYIRLTKSIPYFDSTGKEPLVTDAKVLIADTSNFKIFPFTYSTISGKYEWKPNKSTGDTFQIGHSYALFIVQGGDTMLSISKLNPTVVKFDSIHTATSVGNGPPNRNPGMYAEIFAYDLTGLGNYYWIKTFRNDTFMNQVQKLNISQDMGNNSNGQDGDLFIYPKRFIGITLFERPYQDGEKVRVEIHSITPEAYYWFNLVINQIRNQGLFATPPVNIGTNIISYNPKKTIPLAGFYCMSAVNKKEIRIKE